MLLRHGAPIEYVIATAKKVNENIASFTSAVCRVLMKYCTKILKKRLVLNVVQNFFEKLDVRSVIIVAILFV